MVLRFLNGRHAWILKYLNTYVPVIAREYKYLFKYFVESGWLPFIIILVLFTYAQLKSIVLLHFFQLELDHEFSEDC